MTEIVSEHQNNQHTVIDLEKAALSRNCLYAFCADLAKSSASSGLNKRLGTNQVYKHRVVTQLQHTKLEQRPPKGKIRTAIIDIKVRAGQLDTAVQISAMWSQDQAFLFKLN